MKLIIRCLAFLLLWLLAAGVAPVAAHHSTAVYEKKTITLKGTVKEFQYTNPHTWIQLYVTDADNNAVEWGVEGGSPNFLRRKGECLINSIN